MMWLDDGRIPPGEWPFLRTVYAGLRELEESLSGSLDLTEGEEEITITGCLDAYRHAVVRRAVDLAQAVVVSWNAGHLIGSVVCARALLETLAVFHSLLSRAQILVDRGDWAALGKLVDDYAFSKSPNTDQGPHAPGTPPRVSRMVRRFIRDTQNCDGKFWEQICEVAHPNGDKLMLFGGVLQDGRFDVRSAASNEVWLFPAVYNCLYSICWLIGTMLDFDILCEHVRFGEPPNDDHPLVREKAQIDKIVDEMSRKKSC